MASIRTSFEKELRQKLVQKSTNSQSEEAVLLKTFKYFDLNNSGSVDQEEFIKCIERIGIQVFDKNDFFELFNYYDKDQDGQIDYREFTQILFGGQSAQSRQQSTPTKQERDNGYNKSGVDIAQDAVEKFRRKLKSRGGNGILGLGRQFRIFDDDGSRSLSMYEFKKACNDFQVGLSDQELSSAFKFFDRNGDGSIDYDEFLLTVRGPMNNFRRKLVQQAFGLLDKDGSGQITIDDLIGVYNAKMHPDVKAGKRTENEILTEFLNTFENYSLITDGIKDGVVTQQEFEDYYTFISSSIDNDQYFELMMNNAWRMNEGKNKNWNTKGWSNANEGSSQKKQQSVQQAYQNKFQQKEEQPQQQQKEAVKKSRAPYGTSDEPVNYSTNLRPNTAQNNRSEQKQQQQQSRPLNPQKGNFDNDELVQKVRQKIIGRGVRGIFSMGRLFRIIDDDNSKNLDYQEFRKFSNDYRLDLNEQEVLAIFNIFDMNGDGTIDYDEFVRVIRGPMGQRRIVLVRQAYKILDKNGDGQIDLSDIKGVYNAKLHPDVKAGKKTEDEILGEFLDTFEQHHANLHGENSGRNQSVSLDEFLEYYNNISASIDDDSYFELMINNAWKMNSANKTYQKGWAQK